MAAREAPETAMAIGARDAEAIADEIDRLIRATDVTTASMRQVRQAYTRRLRDASPDTVLAIAEALVARQRWVAYELLYYHPGGLSHLGPEAVERLGQGIDGWGSVDAFARYVAGPAWQRGSVSDEAIHRWAASPDRYWRRAALVATVPLNLRAAGGRGDTERTLAVCRMVVADHDDTVVKALSWALRELVLWDPATVSAFLHEHDQALAARVKREVRNKLATGRKNPARGPRQG